VALLELVNDLRDLMREERVTTVAGPAPDLLVQIGLINRAARKILARRPWSFLHRSDGVMFFPAAIEVATSSMSNGTDVQFLGPPPPVVTAFTDGSVSAKLLVHDDTFPQTSYPIRTLDNTFGVSATLTSVYRGPTGNPAVTLYTNEIALPSTVARVLSIRNEDEPIRFETVDSFDDFDRMFPNHSERFSDRPEVVAVGGNVVPTNLNASEASTSTGIGVYVYPPPDTDVLLRYSYVRRIADLEEDTDELVGVPQEVQDLILSVAFVDALMGNIEDDPVRGRTLYAQNELAYADLVAADRKDVGRRMVPKPFGTGTWYDPQRIRSVPEP